MERTYAEYAARQAMELLARICPDVPPWRFLRELAPLEMSEDALYRPFSTLSGGEQSKLLLAMLFSRENRFLLIDEPTNHLDQLGRALVSRYLRSKKGFLLVSHDRAFLDGCVDHILSINRSSIEVQKGNFSSWYENKRRQDAFELSQNERLKKEIGRLKEAARQSSVWADKVEGSKIGKNSAKVRGTADAMGGRAYIGEQSRRMQQRRKNLERRQQNAIEEKSALLKDIERSDALKLHPLNHHAQRLAALRAETGVEFIPSLMSQFTPFYKAAEHGLGRRITTYEYRQVIDEAVRLGLTDGYMQEKSSAREEYTPPFDLEGV